MTISKTGSTADLKMRSVSKRRYVKLQEEYDAELINYTNCKERITELKTILKNREVVTVDNKGKEKHIRLTQAQLSGLSKEVLDRKQELLRVGTKLKRLSDSFKTAARTNRIATTNRINQQREKTLLAREGYRNLEKIKSHVTDQFNDTAKSDTEISTLRGLATTNGRRFHLEFLKKLRKVLQDPQMRDWIMASPKIQGELSRMVRGLYGYKKA